MQQQYSEELLASVRPFRHVKMDALEVVQKLDKCWNWPVTRGNDGYGLFYSRSKQMMAHRLVEDTIENYLSLIESKMLSVSRHLYPDTVAS